MALGTVAILVVLQADVGLDVTVHRCHVKMGTPYFGDPGSPYSYENGDPGPYNHLNMGTPGPHIYMNMGTPELTQLSQVLECKECN